MGAQIVDAQIDLILTLFWSGCQTVDIVKERMNDAPQRTARM